MKISYLFLFAILPLNLLQAQRTADGTDYIQEVGISFAYLSMQTNGHSANQRNWGLSYGIWYGRPLGQKPLYWTAHAHLYDLGGMHPVPYPWGTHARYADFDHEIYASGEEVAHSVISKALLGQAGLTYSPLRNRTRLQPIMRARLGAGYLYNRSRDLDLPMLQRRIIDGSGRITHSQMLTTAGLGAGLDFAGNVMRLGLHINYLHSLHPVSIATEVRYDTDMGQMQTSYTRQPLRMLEYSLHWSFCW